MSTQPRTESSKEEHLRLHREAAEKLRAWDGTFKPGEWAAAIKEREEDQSPPNPYIWPKDRKPAK